MKRQAETAIAVYHGDIKPTLTFRQTFVRDELEAFIAAKHYGPTAIELLAFIQRKHGARAFDVNSVRPRLTEMTELGMVRHGVKRRCDISTKTVLTWLPSLPSRPQQQGFGFPLASA